MAFGGEDEAPAVSENEIGSSESTVVLPPRPQTALDLAAAKLVGTVRSRPGHVVVVGESAAEAQSLFQTIESQLGRFLRIGVDGREIDPESVVQALWEADGRTATSGGRPLSMMRVLAGEAALAGRPIVVTVTDADAASAGQLERLRQMIESVPAAEEVVRIVLLGGPTLLDTLARPEARAVAMRVVASVRVPSATATPVTATIPPPETQTRPRAGAMWAAGVLGAGLLALMWLRGASEPPTPAVIAAPAPIEAGPARAPVPAPTTPAPVAAAPADAVPPPAPADAVAPPIPADAVSPPAPAEAVAPPVPADAVPPPAPADVPVARPAARVHAATPVPAARAPLALQVGAFTSAANAEELRRRLGDRFGATSVSSVERDGRRYYRVRVSGFAAEADRRAAASALRGAGFSPVPVRD